MRTQRKQIGVKRIVPKAHEIEQMGGTMNVFLDGADVGF
jgi:hypothetical protein